MVKEENKMSVPKSLTTEAWLLMGLTGSSQGVMKLEKGNLLFSICGRGNLSFWHLMELKKMIAVKDLIKKFKISFMKPANTEFNVGNPAMPISSRINILKNNLSNLKTGMDVAKLWKEVFMRYNIIQK